jgi:hypothetical protein
MSVEDRGFLCAAVSYRTVMGCVEDSRWPLVADGYVMVVHLTAQRCRLVMLNGNDAGFAGRMQNCLIGLVHGFFAPFMMI